MLEVSMVMEAKSVRRDLFVDKSVAGIEFENSNLTESLEEATQRSRGDHIISNYGQALLEAQIELQNDEYSHWLMTSLSESH